MPRGIPKAIWEQRQAEKKAFDGTRHKLTWKSEHQLHVQEVVLMASMKEELEKFEADPANQVSTKTGAACDPVIMSKSVMKRLKEQKYPSPEGPMQKAFNKLKE